MKSVLFLCLTVVSIEAFVLPLQLNLGGDKTPSLRSIETCRKFFFYKNQKYSMLQDDQSIRHLNYFSFKFQYLRILFRKSLE